MIVFHPLRKEQLTLIVDVQIDHLRNRLAQRGLKLVLTDEARRLLADEGYDPTLGARPLKRVIQQRLENPLAQRILAGEYREGDTITVRPDAAKGAFRFERGAEVVEGELVGGPAWTIARHRRPLCITIVECPARSPAWTHTSSGIGRTYRRRSWSVPAIG